MALLNVADVRTINTETFRLKDYIHYENSGLRSLQQVALIITLIFIMNELF